jgi:hypothetical protein
MAGPSRGRGTAVERVCCDLRFMLVTRGATALAWRPELRSSRLFPGSVHAFKSPVETRTGVRACLN